MEREIVKQLKDLHEHQPLVLNEEPRDESRRTECSACNDIILFDQSYSCADAECKDFHLHKRCAEAPSKVNDLSIFQDHSSLFLKLQGDSICLLTCLFCRSWICTVFYSCDGSGDLRFDLCVKCGLFIVNYIENNEKLKLEYHPHQLLVLANHKDELARIACDACKEALSDSICVCFDCGLFLHKKCIDKFPLQINHPCHRRHPLFLDLKKKYLLLSSSECEICKSEIFGLCYGCSSCKFYIHRECASLGSFNNIADETHQHTFNFVWRRDTFICEACGTEVLHASKVCSVCHINVHDECTSLPQIMRIVRHPDHSISHNYFAKENGFDKCRICYDKVKKEYGCYSCSKEDCNYIFHVNCAMQEFKVFDEDEPEDSVVESFQIIERNDKGEAVKIQHFAHEHYLMLGEKIKEGDDHCCDGCIQFLSGLFYYCSKCDFFLHKSCAELPKKKHHWFHYESSTLEFASSFLVSEKQANQVQVYPLRCHFCNQWCNGLFYYCCPYKCCSYLVSTVICVRCASLCDAYDPHPGHEHLIFFDGKYKGQCIGCSNYTYQGTTFRCKVCDNYDLDFCCMTLPIEARYKWDKHLLKLVYGDENDDPEKHYCDVCEEERNPNHWFYHCSTCDNSIHPKCIIGEQPFIKIGSTLTTEYLHPHPLTFVKKVYYYPECSECSKPCVDLALECSQSECNYIVHFTCLNDFWFSF